MLSKVEIEKRIIQADLMGDEAEVLRLLKILNKTECAQKKPAKLRLVECGVVETCDHGELK